MVSCYFGCRSTLCYLLRREALGQGISFAAIAVLNVYTNSSSLLYHRHRGRSLPSCRLGFTGKAVHSLLADSCDICKPSSMLSLLAVTAFSLGG